jgi:predicted porin
MGSYKWGNTSFILSGGMTNADSTSASGAIAAAAKRQAHTFTAGVIHNFSKRTSVFGGYQHVYVNNSNGAAANDLPSTGDTASTNGAGGLGYAAPGYATGNRATYTIGIRHNF